MLSCGNDVRTTRLARMFRKMAKPLEPCPTHSSQLSTNDLIRAIRSCLSQLQIHSETSAFCLPPDRYKFAIHCRYVDYGRIVHTIK
ncbi:metacaspase-1 [Cryptococcus decagattii]|uniref:Metacaspase-1 n=1 Tax=Cryptococcus decagattii TaxID=1859122 RepID=A0ABZ2AWM4_9TREE